MVTIEKTGLDRIMNSYRGNEVFAQALEHASEPGRLVSLLANYLEFNSLGGTGVGQTYVTAQVGLRRDIFRDPAEPLVGFSDRSAEVAKDIFFAARDELSDTTHRLLALATLKGCIRFFRFAPEEANRTSAINPATHGIMERMRYGYGMNRALDDLELLETIGFHLGSEWSGAPEFKRLAHFLERTYPALVDYLQKTRMEIGEDVYHCYAWIDDHTRVEEEHADKGRRAANTALRYFIGDRLQAHTAILNGVRNFFSIQTDFALSLLKTR